MRTSAERGHPADRNTAGTHGCAAVTSPWFLWFSFRHSPSGPAHSPLIPCRWQPGWLEPRSVSPPICLLLLRSYAPNTTSAIAVSAARALERNRSTGSRWSRRTASGLGGAPSVIQSRSRSRPVDSACCASSAIGCPRTQMRSTSIASQPVGKTTARLGQLAGSSAYGSRPGRP